MTCMGDWWLAGDAVIAGTGDAATAGPGDAASTNIAGATGSPLTDGGGLNEPEELGMDMAESGIAISSPAASDTAMRRRLDRRMLSLLRVGGDRWRGTASCTSRVLRRLATV